MLYTNPSAIRHAAGLARADVESDYFTSSVLSAELEVALYKWLPSHATDYAIWVAAGTADDDVKASLLTLYCTYFCAAKVVGTILTVMKAGSDGKNQFTRFDVDLSKVAAELTAKAEEYKASLLEMTAVATVEPVRQATFVEPDYDPVLGQ